MLDFSFRYNRALSRITRAARTRATQRPQAREPCSIDQLLVDAGIAGEAARSIVEELARALGVTAELLRADDRLGELCRVSATELPDATADLWEASKLPNWVEIASYDIMHLAETRISRAAWTSYWKSLDPRPRNEEEWIDLFMEMHVNEMHVNEFLKFILGVRTGGSSIASSAL